MPQYSPEWYAVRLGKVTASNFAEATAKGRGGSVSVGLKKLMFKLMAERLTGLPEESYSNKAMDYGSETEQEARKYYEALNGVSVRQVGFIQRDDDVGCSPDGLVGEPGMVQFKCPFSTTHLKYLLAGKMPTDYVKQVQGEMWVAEREWSDFVSYDPRVKKRPYFCQRIYRDEKAIKELHIGIVMFLSEMKDLMEKLTSSPY